MRSIISASVLAPVTPSASNSCTNSRLDLLARSTIWRATGARSTEYVPSSEAPASPRSTAASFHARLYESCTDVLEPSPLLGGWRWIASPAQKTRPDCRCVAYISLLPHSEV